MAHEGNDVDTEPFTVEDEPPAQPEPDPAAAIFCRRQFVLLSICFGVNHATVTTPLLYASTVLGNDLGQKSDAVLYGMCLLTSLLFATTVQSLIGSKKGLAASMLAYAIYVFFFGIAASQCRETDKTGACTVTTQGMWIFGLVGAFVGGIGAGVLWTCQGVYFSSICSRVAIAEVKPQPAVTAELAGVFAFWFLLAECLARALSSYLVLKLHFSKGNMFYLYGGVATLVTIIYISFAREMETGERARGSVCGKVLMAVEQWTDPKTWLLQFTNITFGFVAAYLGGYVNAEITSKAFNSDSLGFCGALLSLVASIMSRVFSPLAAQVGKGPVMCLGAISFFLIGVLSRWGALSKGEHNHATIIFYILMGIGRAVYESTNKGIFADFFPGDKSPGAFANVFVFGTGASTVAFILGSLSSSPESTPLTVEFYLVIVCAALTVPGFVGASLLKMNGERRQNRAQLNP
uniref:Major facilitator superfamily (MFS) profile domain-containing protein n=1 Tax=Noctiluca scintillans TaxID=2966 RepID=A0A7S1FKS2_NOCSC|mmetsp:Transcript_8981/g.25048  ORF Transcript_8981/g.25048 Transcript_8981/m.25048 type:complete len:463 (+) Transcript_8981:67-1455(+)